MFTQKISMDCSPGQYYKFLKHELSKMEYQKIGLDLSSPGTILVNNCDDRNGVLIFLPSEEKASRDRIYLGKFNARLYLAIAAMTDGFGYGEWSILNSGDGRFIRRMDIGMGYQFENGERVDPTTLNKGHRKATRSELIQRFGEIELPGDLSQFEKGDFITLEYFAGKVTGIVKNSLFLGDNGFSMVVGIRSGKDLVFDTSYGIQRGDIVRYASSLERLYLHEELAKKGLYYDAVTHSLLPTGTFNSLESVSGKGTITVSEEGAIDLLKSKGYKILKPITWEEV